MPAPFAAGFCSTRLASFFAGSPSIALRSSYQRTRKLLRNVQLIAERSHELAPEGRIREGLSEIGNGRGKLCSDILELSNQSPLEPINFQSKRGQRAARHSHLVARVLLSEGSQFLNSLSSLEEIVDGLGGDLNDSARRLSTHRPFAHQLWISLDSDHFDMNTCLPRNQRSL